MRIAASALLGLSLALACAGREALLLTARDGAPSAGADAAGAADFPAVPWSQLKLDSAPPLFVVTAREGALEGLALEEVPFEAAPWQRLARWSDAPRLGRELVVYGEGGRFTALLAATGEQRWSIPARGARLLAAADADGHAALMLDDPRIARRWVALLGKSGELLREVEAEAPLGKPWLVRGTLLLPWSERFISAIDLGSQREVARESSVTPLTQVFEHEAQLFIGGPPWRAPLSMLAPPLSPPRRPLPGRVETGSVQIRSEGASEVSWLFLPPLAGGEPGGVYLAVHDHVVLGLDARQGALLWVQALAGRALAAALGADGISICDESGKLQFIEREGGVRWHVALARSAPNNYTSRALLACALSSGRTPTAPAGNASARAAGSLIDQLSRILSSPDPALTNAQRFLARELSARPEPEATRVLIELASRRSAAVVLEAEAEDLLATRRNGADYMLAALAGAPPFATDPFALPPLGALADALAALEERAAAPLLAQQLNRPGHTARARARAAAALGLLASEQQYEPLARFFALHRTTADQPEAIDAVIFVAKTLLRIGGSRGQRAVTFALRDPLTVARVRSELAAIVNAGPVEPQDPEAAESERR